ncbi:MAG: hypothetical protein H8E48_13130 [Chloroflexi bacterium]|nr:hypothetical protein [Chloroflexota bacterium]
MQRRYGVKGALSKDPVTNVARINPVTQEVQESLVSLEVTDIDSYVAGSWYHVAVDNDVAYRAALSNVGQQSRGKIASVPLGDSSADIQIDTFTVPGAPGKAVAILKVDGDDGSVVIQPRFSGRGDSELILFDINSGSLDLV